MGGGTCWHNENLILQNEYQTLSMACAGVNFPIWLIKPCCGKGWPMIKTLLCKRTGCRRTKLCFKMIFLIVMSNHYFFQKSRVLDEKNNDLGILWAACKSQTSRLYGEYPLPPPNIPQKYHQDILKICQDIPKIPPRYPQDKMSSVLGQFTWKKSCRKKSLCLSSSDQLSE